MRITVPIDMGDDLEPLGLDGCQHEEFATLCRVTGVQRKEGEAPHTFDAEVRLLCLQCGELMKVRGTPHEIGFRRPSRDITGTRVSLPMEPSGDYDLEALDSLRKSEDE